MAPDTGMMTPVIVGLAVLALWIAAGVGAVFLARSAWRRIRRHK